MDGSAPTEESALYEGPLQIAETVVLRACGFRPGFMSSSVGTNTYLIGEDRGLPVFSMVGLPETAVRESKDRVRAAIKSAGFSFPDGRIIVSLGPADMKKSGGRFDLAIAIGILAAKGFVSVANADK